MLWPPIGIRLMVSVPPATMQSPQPARTRSAAKAIACKPEEQKRLTVKAEPSLETRGGRGPGRRPFTPDPAWGVAHPIIQPPFIGVPGPGVPSMADLIPAAAMSSGRVSFRLPLGALPTAVLSG